MFAQLLSLSITQSEFVLLYTSANLEKKFGLARAQPLNTTRQETAVPDQLIGGFRDIGLKLCGYEAL